jgi:hypothetical protein
LSFSANACCVPLGREMLIKAIHGCGVKFPEIAHSVVLLLMDFLGSDGASGVINFVRCGVHTHPWVCGCVGVGVGVGGGGGWPLPCTAAAIWSTVLCLPREKLLPLLC